MRNEAWIFWELGIGLWSLGLLNGAFYCHLERLAYHLDFLLYLI